MILGCGIPSSVKGNGLLPSTCWISDGSIQGLLPFDANQLKKVPQGQTTIVGTHSSRPDSRRTWPKFPKPTYCIAIGPLVRVQDEEAAGLAVAIVEAVYSGK